jgi:hypothetical protein
VPRESSSEPFPFELVKLWVYAAGVAAASLVSEISPLPWPLLPFEISTPFVAMNCLT